MDTKVRIDYSNYSIEDLIKLRAELDNLIDRKKIEAYNTAVNNVLKELEKMAKDFPYEDAFDYEDGTVTWKEFYNAVYDFHL